MKRIVSIIKESITPACLILLVVAVLLLMLSGRTQGSSMTQLEARISETLSRMEGAGKVRVVIRTAMKSGQSKALGAYSTNEEVPCGALAIVEGGSDPLIRMRLTDALCALLGLHTSQVDVISMNGG